MRTLPESQQDTATLNTLDVFFRYFPHLVVVPVTRSIAQIAARLRGRTRLRLPDALIIATAVNQHCPVIVGNDAAWRGKTAPIEFAYLDTWRGGSPS